MAIIYSYPATAPTLDDLLIGTDVGADNATKSFTVQSLVALVNAAAGNGTVTSVQLATDAFLTATGGPIVDAGTITVGFSATGTPSTTTFLRGDNQWVVPTVSAGISVLGQSTILTSDVSSFNFVGSGVTSSGNGNDVIISIPGASNAVESIIAGGGISINNATGNVIITNSGITSLVEGGGISIATTAAGVSTLTVSSQSTGTVSSVTAGPGLSLLSGTISVDPQIGLDYTGADTYITQPAAAVPLEADFIPFHSVTGTAVKKVTFGNIQASTLSLVNTAIATEDADNVKNGTDNKPSVNKAKNIITLTQAEWIGIGAGNYDDSTLYFTTAAAQPQNTVNFTIVTTAINVGTGCGFTPSSNFTSITGAVGSSYTLETTITPSGANCSLSGGSATQTLTGTIPATPTPAPVTFTLAARTISAPAAPSDQTDTLQSISTTNITGAALNTGYTVSSNSVSGQGGFNTDIFNLLATAATNYEFTTGGATSSTLTGITSPATSTYGANETTGTFPASSSGLKKYDVTYTVDTSGISGGFTIDISGGTFSGPNTSGSISLPYGTGPINVTVTVSPTGTDTYTATSANPLTVTLASVGSSGNTITLTPTGSSGASTGTVNLASVSSAVTGAGSTQFTTVYSSQVSGSSAVPGYGLGNAVTGTAGQNVSFTAATTANSGYVFTSGPTFSIVSGSNPQTITAGTATPVTGQIGGNIIAVRQAFARSVGGNISICGTTKNYTSYLLKGSGNTSVYPEIGDTAYSSATGTSYLSANFYAATVNSGTTQAIIRVVGSGQITQAEGCDP